jgi:membrane-associated phospholipid phosphatase
VHRFVLPATLLIAASVLGAILAPFPPPAFDVEISQRLQGELSPDLASAVRATGFVLRPPWHILTCVAIAGLVAAADGVRSAVFVLVCVLASLLLIFVAKRVYNRHRPHPSVIEGGSLHSVHSYPSGHVLWTTAAMGSLWVLTTRRRSRGVKIAGFFVAVLAVSWVAAGRIHAGRHFFTDAVGSVLFGAALVAFAYVLILEPEPPPPTTEASRE